MSTGIAIIATQTIPKTVINILKSKNRYSSKRRAFHSFSSFDPVTILFGPGVVNARIATTMNMIPANIDNMFKAERKPEKCELTNSNHKLTTESGIASPFTSTSRYLWII